MVGCFVFPSHFIAFNIKIVSRLIYDRLRGILACFHHFLQLQYLAVILLGGLLSHLCLARKLRLRPGMDFFIVIFGSPKRIVRLLPLEHALTTNFLFAPGVRRGLLQGRFLGFIKLLG